MARRGSPNGAAVARRHAIERAAVWLDIRSFTNVLAAWCAAEGRLVHPRTDLRYGGGHLYFVRAPSGALKVGVSQSPGYRIALFEYASSCERHRFQCVIGAYDRLDLVLAVDGAAKFERALHKTLADELLGFEWFRGPATESLLSMALERARKAA